MSDFPKQILFEKWADSQFSWQGMLDLKQLPRLANLCADDNIQLRVDCRMYKKNGVLWLSYDVQGVLQLPCDRCLDTLKKDVSGSYKVALIKHDGELSGIADDDYIRLDEISDEAGTLPRFLPLLDILEDELLLTLPLASTHDDCTAAVEPVVEDSRENPFIVLAQLKQAR